jgi:hypothetical protein
MKKIFIMSCLLFISCGKNSNESTKTSLKNPVRSIELSIKESEFIQSLLEKGSMEQNELMKNLASLPDYNQETLKKLDSVINLSCNQSSGLCYFSSKE